MKKRQAALLDLHHDILREILIRVAGSSNGAKDFAKAISVKNLIKLLSTLPEKDDDSGVALSWSAILEELKSMMNDVQKSFLAGARLGDLRDMDIYIKHYMRYLIECGQHDHECQTILRHFVDQLDCHQYLWCCEALLQSEARQFCVEAMTMRLSASKGLQLLGLNREQGEICHNNHHPLRTSYFVIMVEELDKELTHLRALKTIIERLDEASQRKALSSLPRVDEVAAIMHEIEVTKAEASYLQEYREQAISELQALLRHFLEDEDVLRAVAFDDMLVSSRWGLLQLKGGLVYRCAQAGQVQAQLILAKVVLMRTSQLLSVSNEATDQVEPSSCEAQSSDGNSFLENFLPEETWPHSSGFHFKSGQKVTRHSAKEDTEDNRLALSRCQSFILEHARGFERLITERDCAASYVEDYQAGVLSEMGGFFSVN
ncbi:hypothetical protein Cgig2_006096 [Carnegiea gigantea]|uniref:Uncharacterized protein n=1 Tax=Carnegiea gigantea TaxID=171969 RepID=A0A9Q1KWS4_9CARY|nr:hypothetical protein Cgig2_006096 [Carnegiea gigantea]